MTESYTKVRLPKLGQKYTGFSLGVLSIVFLILVLLVRGSLKFRSTEIVVVEGKVVACKTFNWPKRTVISVQRWEHYSGEYYTVSGQVDLEVGREYVLVFMRGPFMLYSRLIGTLEKELLEEESRL